MPAKQTQPEIEFRNRFPNGKAARKLLEKYRWNGKPECPSCGSQHRINKRNREGYYRCLTCQKDFTVRTGTIFAKSKIPLHKWFYGIHLMVTTSNGVSPDKLSKDLKITPKSAWSMQRKIRAASVSLEDAIIGIVEINDRPVPVVQKGNKGNGPNQNNHYAIPNASLSEHEKVMLEQQRLKFDNEHHTNLSSILEQGINGSENSDEKAFDNGIEFFWASLVHGLGNSYKINGHKLFEVGVNDKEQKIKGWPRPNLANNGETFLQDWKNRIHLGDCLEVMRQLPSSSIDLVVTSPPYADARSHTYGGIHPDKYIEWFSPRAAEIRRILKPTGSFVLNIKEKAAKGERHTYVLELILHLKKDLGFLWIEEYIWHKTTSMPGKWKYRFRDAWERMLHFSVTKDLKINQEAVMQPVNAWTEKRLKNMSLNDLTRQNSGTNPKSGRRISAWVGRDKVYPSNVIHRPPICHNTGHSAAYPEWLPEFFIKLFTDKGDVVLDPFSGSGTTSRVASQLERDFVGIEIMPEYVEEWG